MATYTAFADMSAGDKQQLVLSLASLVLIDAGADITAAALTSVVTASGNTADASWTASFESICAGKEIEKAITSGCGGGGGGGGGGGAAAAVEEEKVEEEPEEEAAIGGLFGGGGDEEDAAW